MDTSPSCMKLMNKFSLLQLTYNQKQSDQLLYHHVVGSEYAQTKHAISWMLALHLLTLIIMLNKSTLFIIRCQMDVLTFLRPHSLNILMIICLGLTDINLNKLRLIKRLKSLLQKFLNLLIYQHCHHVAGLEYAQMKLAPFMMLALQQQMNHMMECKTISYITLYLMVVHTMVGLHNLNTLMITCPGLMDINPNKVKLSQKLKFSYLKSQSQLH